MATVEGVGGPIEEEDLGVCLIHEHLGFWDEANRAQFPHLYDDDAIRAAAVEGARAMLGAGVGTVIEPTAMYGGRDIRFLASVAEETGLQIVACTGIYTYSNLPLFWQNRDADAMADAFAHDVEEGIQGTSIKAAFLKCAADEPGVNENVEKVHRACARASLRTGAPIMAHSRPASNTGPRQIEIFEEEGVDPAKVQIAHTGDTDDLEYIRGLLERGVMVGLDRYGLDLFLPTEKRNKTTARLLDEGWVDQLVLSQDYCGTIDWFPQETVEQLLTAGLVDDWSFTFLFDQVIPALREAGMTDDQLATMLETNPRRWLTP